MTNTATVAQALVEYGQAWRGDWSNFDGRTCRDDMERIAKALQSPDSVSVEEARDLLGLCPDGGGHWPQYCADYECQTWQGYRKTV